MDSMFPKKIPKRQDTSEKKKAKQYGAAALLCILAAVIMTAIKWIWGGVTLGSGRDEVPIGFIIFCVRNVILLFGGIDMISAAWHFILWDRKGRPDMEDDGDSLLSDWKSGERSPVKVSLALMAGILALALVIVLQG